MTTKPLGKPELEKLAATLREMRGTKLYPPTVERLLEAAGVRADPVELSLPAAAKYVRTAAKKPGNSGGRKNPLPPKATGKRKRTSPATDYAATLVFLSEDLEEIAVSDVLVRHLIKTARTDITYVAAPSALLGLLPSSLEKKARPALMSRISAEKLPPGVGMTRIGGRWKLFLLTDMRSGGPVSDEDDREPFSEAFGEAFDELDLKSGKRNYVLLHDLRQRLAMIPRPDFDKGLNELRRSQKYSLDSADGRHGRLTPEQVDAGIREAGSVLVYVARR